MKSIYSSTTLVVALAAPLTVLSQHHEGGHDLEKRQDWTKDINWSTVDYGNAFSSTPVAAPVAAPTTSPVVVANKMAVAPPSSAPVAVASSSSSSDSSPGKSSTPSLCSGSGMMIEWTSDSASVPWSWDGGSGTTSPGSCTDLGTSFSGQLAVNGTGGTIFEGNYNGGDMYYDVSFIIGYSAPMMCSNQNTMSGCSLDLHHEAAKGGWQCPSLGDDDHICTNPVGSKGDKTPGAYLGDMSAFPWCRACSAPHSFFQPCSGAGYTYPMDDVATQHAKGTIQCCIGTSCGMTGREASSKGGHPVKPAPGVTTPCIPCPPGELSKRGLEDVFDQYEKDARDLTPLLPRRKRSSHRHAHAHGAKGAQ